MPKAERRQSEKSKNLRLRNKMQNENRENLQKAVGEMRKRREKMEDGRRYIIYYTFGKGSAEAAENRPGNEKRENV